MLICSCELKMVALDTYKKEGKWWTVYRCEGCDKTVIAEGSP